MSLVTILRETQCVSWDELYQNRELVGSVAANSDPTSGPQIVRETRARYPSLSALADSPLSRLTWQSAGQVLQD